jgi:DNA repair photolyase
MNIYRGCQHQCIYCDTRSNVYNVGDLSHIRIKQNALELLEQQLKKIKNKGTIGTGSMNDPYMPIEKEMCLVKKALEIIARYKFPVHITTKSNLVLRDIELIKKISEIYAAVSFTITTIDDSLAKEIEPGAPISSERLQAMRVMSDFGIYTGAVLTPVLPFITDTTENIKAIVNAVAHAGSKYILFWSGLTQREGQREYFYDQLDKKFPGIKSRYQNLFGNNYNCPSPNSESIYKAFREMCLLHKINFKMEHYLPTLTSAQLNLF